MIRFSVLILCLLICVGCGPQQVTVEDHQSTPVHIKLQPPVTIESFVRRGEPFESTSESEKVLHVGTVGKLMPLIVTQGLLSHMKEPLKGVNAISLLAKIVEKIDLNPLLSDAAYGEQSPLPSWSFMRDLKEHYDVSTVLRAAGYFSLLYLDKSPQDLLNLIQGLMQEALDEFYEKYTKLQDQYQESKSIAKPRALTYQDLLEQRFETELRNQTNAAILVEKTDFARSKMTLSNYFYKVKHQYPLTEKQQDLYDILGDVNPEYALKYMTTFLLKFLKKDQLMQKRRDIFVDSLVVLGYIVQNEDGKYELAIDLDKERLTFYLA